MASIKERALKVARVGAVIAAVAIPSAYIGGRIGAGEPFPFAAAQTGPTPAPQPTPDARIAQAQAQASEALTKMAELKTQLDALLKARAIPEVQLSQKGDIKVFGVPDRPNNTVDIARGIFVNTLGMGSEAFLADGAPGTNGGGALLVGPDFGFTGPENPYGQNPKGWVAMYQSKGHIKPFSPVSQEVLRADAKHDQNLPEGGFVKASLGKGLVDVVDGAGNVIARFDLPHLGADHNYFLVVRGRYPDAQLVQNSQRNLNVRLYPETQTPGGFVLGHTEVEMYEPGEETNSGFISQGQFLQMAQTSARNGTNCGAGGCSRLTAVFFDVNTGAFAMMRHTGDRNSNPAQGWVGLDKNF